MQTKDDKLKEYYSILQATKQLSKRLETLRLEVLAWGGSCSTDNYVAVVEEQKRTTLKSIVEFDAKLGRQLLLEMELLQVLEVRILRVAPKLQKDVLL